MAKVETVTYGQSVDQVRVPENYTQVTGLYAYQTPVTPQFLSSADNVQQPPAELLHAMEMAYAQQELRFFRML